MELRLIYEAKEGRIRAVTQQELSDLLLVRELKENAARSHSGVVGALMDGTLRKSKRGRSTPE